MDTLPPSTSSTDAQIKKPFTISDISHRAHTLGRIIDRLNPNKYITQIVKNAIHSVDWEVENYRVEFFKRLMGREQSISIDKLPRGKYIIDVTDSGIEISYLKKIQSVSLSNKTYAPE